MKQRLRGFRKTCAVVLSLVLVACTAAVLMPAREANAKLTVRGYVWQEVTSISDFNNENYFIFTSSEYNVGDYIDLSTDTLAADDAIFQIESTIDANGVATTHFEDTTRVYDKFVDGNTSQDAETILWDDTASNSYRVTTGGQGCQALVKILEAGNSFRDRGYGGARYLNNETYTYGTGDQRSQKTGTGWVYNNYDVYTDGYFTTESPKHIYLLKDEQPPAPAPTPTPGAVNEDKTKEANNYGGATMSNSTTELQNIVLTDEQKAKVNSGKGVDIWIETNDITSSVSDQDKALVESAKTPGYIVGGYLDINLYIQFEAESSVKVTQLPNGKVRITMLIPEALRKSGRTFQIIKLHDGVPTVIPATVDGDYFSFETDQFSTYAVSYMDGADTSGNGNASGTTDVNSSNNAAGNQSVNKAPKTADNTPIMAVVIMIVAFGVAGTVLVLRRRDM